MTLKRLKRLIFLHLCHLPIPSKKLRPLLYRYGGVNIPHPEHVFIGAGCVFDTNYPDLIHIEEGVYVTNGCVILAHFRNTKLNTPMFTAGIVRLKRNCFIGCNSVICKPITIGENAIVGAGSIVTKDIPDNEVWAGNPAKFIKKRNIQ